MALQLGSNYLNRYEAAKEQLRGDRAFDEQSWVSQAQRGEDDLNLYIQAIEKSKDIEDWDMFKQKYNYDNANAETRAAALANEAFANRDNTDEKRTRYQYNPDGSIKTDDKGNYLVEEFAASDYEYRRQLIKQNNDFIQQQNELKVKQEIKDGQNFMVTGLATVAGEALELGAGAINTIDNLASLAYGAVSGNLDEAVKRIGTDQGRILQLVEDWIVDWESNYTYLRNVDGSYTGFGELVGGVAYTLGQMAPSMLFAQGLGAAAGGLSKAGAISANVAGTIGKVGGVASQTLFYTSMASGQIRETYKQFAVNDVSSSSAKIVLNASMKAGFQWAVEYGLGKMLGNTSLDNLVFGRNLSNVAADSLGGAATKRLILDAIKEGNEEIWQDVSDHLVDRLIFDKLLGDANYKQLSELTLEGLVDTFVISALASVAGSGVNIARSTRISTGDVDAKGKAIKLSKFQSWEYGNVQEAISTAFNEVLTIANKYYQDVGSGKVSLDYKTDAKLKASVMEVYTGYRLLTSVYSSMGEDRATAVNNILSAVKNLTERSTYKIDDALTASYTMINSLSEIEESAKKSLAEKLATRNMAGNTTVVERTADLADIKLDSPEAQESLKKVLQMYKKLNKVVVTEEGTGTVLYKDTAFIPLSFLENMDAETVTSTIIEQRAAEVIASFVNTKYNKIQITLNDISAIYAKTTGLEKVSQEEVLFNLVFNPSFFNIVLHEANKDMFKLVTAITKEFRNVRIDDVSDALYKKKLGTIKDNMTSLIIDYCVNQHNAEIPTDILDSNQMADIERRRWNKNAADRICFNKGVVNEKEYSVVDERIDAAPLTDAIKSSLKNVIREGTTDDKIAAFNLLDNTYDGMYFGKYDGKTYMPSTSTANNVFNDWLIKNGLTLKTIVDKNILTEEQTNFITSTYGSVNSKSLYQYYNELFKNSTNGRYSFAVSGIDTTRTSIIDNKTNTEVGFSLYKVQAARSEGTYEERLGNKFVEGSAVRNQYLSELLNENLDYATAQFVTIDDVVNDAALLSEKLQNQITAKYGDTNPENVFMYLRDMFIDKYKSVTVLAKPDGSYVMGNLEHVYNMYSADDILSKVKNKSTLSGILRSKYLTGMLKSTTITIVTNENFSTYASIVGDKNFVALYNPTKTIYRGKGKYRKGYTSIDNTIYINSNILSKGNDFIKYVLAHEIQHAIQLQNNLNMGFSNTWMQRLPIAQQNDIIKDIEKHVPTLFGEKMSREEKVNIVNNYVYYGSGESEAYGLQGTTALNFYPILVKLTKDGTSIQMPWGNNYTISGMTPNQLVIWANENIEQVIDPSRYDKFHYLSQFRPNLTDYRKYPFDKYMKWLSQTDKTGPEPDYDPVVKQKQLKFWRKYQQWLKDYPQILKWMGAPIGQATEGGTDAKREFYYFLKTSKGKQAKEEGFHLLYDLLDLPISYEEFLELDVPVARIQTNRVNRPSEFISMGIVETADNLIEAFHRQQFQFSFEKDAYLLTNVIKIKDCMFYMHDQLSSNIVPTLEVLVDSDFAAKSDVNLIAYSQKDINNNGFLLDAVVPYESVRTRYISNKLYDFNLEHNTELSKTLTNLFYQKIFNTRWAMSEVFKDSIFALGSRAVDIINNGEIPYLVPGSKIYREFITRLKLRFPDGKIPVAYISNDSAGESLPLIEPRTALGDIEATDIKWAQIQPFVNEEEFNKALTNCVWDEGDNLTVKILLADLDDLRFDMPVDVDDVFNVDFYLRDSKLLDKAKPINLTTKFSSTYYEPRNGQPFQLHAYTTDDYSESFDITDTNSTSLNPPTNISSSFVEDEVGEDEREAADSFFTYLRSHKFITEKAISNGMLQSVISDTIYNKYSNPVELAKLLSDIDNRLERNYDEGTKQYVYTVKEGAESNEFKDILAKYGKSALKRLREYLLKNVAIGADSPKEVLDSILKKRLLSAGEDVATVLDRVAALDKQHIEKIEDPDRGAVYRLVDPEVQLRTVASKLNSIVTDEPKSLDELKPIIEQKIPADVIERMGGIDKMIQKVLKSDSANFVAFSEDGVIKLKNVGPERIAISKSVEPTLKGTSTKALKAAKASKVTEEKVPRYINKTIAKNSNLKYYAGKKYYYNELGESNIKFIVSTTGKEQFVPKHIMDAIMSGNKNISRLVQQYFANPVTETDINIPKDIIDIIEGGGTEAVKAAKSIANQLVGPEHKLSKSMLKAIYNAEENIVERLKSHLSIVQEDVNNEFFKMVNDAYFHNSEITTNKQLTDLIDNASSFWADINFLRTYVDDPSFPWEKINVSKNIQDTHLALQRILSAHPNYAKSYARLENNYTIKVIEKEDGKKRSIPFDIDMPSARLIFMDKYTGTLQSMRSTVEYLRWVSANNMKYRSHMFESRLDETDRSSRSGQKEGTVGIFDKLADVKAVNPFDKIMSETVEFTPELRKFITERVLDYGKLVAANTARATADTKYNGEWTEAVDKEYRQVYSMFKSKVQEAYNAKDINAIISLGKKASSIIHSEYPDFVYTDKNLLKFLRGELKGIDAKRFERKYFTEEALMKTVTSQNTKVFTKYLNSTEGIDADLIQSTFGDYVTIVKGKKGFRVVFSPEVESYTSQNFDNEQLQKVNDLLVKVGSDFRKVKTDFDGSRSDRAYRDRIISTLNRATANLNKAIRSGNMIHLHLIEEEYGDYITVEKTKDGVKLHLKRSALYYNPEVDVKKTGEKSVKTKAPLTYKLRSELEELEKTIKMFNDKVKKGYFGKAEQRDVYKKQQELLKRNSEQLKVMLNTIAMEKTNIVGQEAKTLKKQATPKTVRIKDDVVTIKSVRNDGNMPVKLKKLLESSYTEKAKSKVKFISNDTDEHNVANIEQWKIEHAETLLNLTDDDVNDILSFFENSSVAIDIDHLGDWNAIQLGTLAWIMQGSRLGKMFITPENRERARALFGKLASSLGIGLNVVGQVQNMINPEIKMAQNLMTRYGIDVAETDLSNLLQAINTGNTAKISKAVKQMYDNAAAKYTGNKKTFWEKVLTFERFAMLSAPSTWIRNKISNILIGGFTTKSGKHIKGLNEISADIGDTVLDISKKFFKKEFRRSDVTAIVKTKENGKYVETETTFKQYKLTGTKISDNVKTFIDDTIIKTGLMDMLDQGLADNKYDVRRIVRDVSQDATESNLAEMISTSIALKVLHGNETDIWKKLFAKEKLTADEENKLKNLNGVYSFVMTMLSDESAIRYSAIAYFGKMLTEDNTNLSEGLSADVLGKLVDAYTLAAFDYMHKPNFMTKVEDTMRKKWPQSAYFMYKQLFPFASASWNWFMEGVSYSPVGLVKAIVNYVNLEKVVAKYEDVRQQGEVGPSGRFAEYIARRDIGKGILGSIGYAIGTALAAFGLAGIDDEDGVPKLKVFDIKVDLSDLFGSQGLLYGIALTSGLMSSDADVFKTLNVTLDQVFRDSVFSDMYNLFRYDNSIGEFFSYMPFKVLNMMIPNFIKMLSSTAQIYKVKYDKGLLGNLEKLATSAIPGLSYAFPTYYDPYTGTKQTSYKFDPSIELLINIANKAGVIDFEAMYISPEEKLAVQHGVTKSQLTGSYTVNGQKVQLNASLTGKANQWYGTKNKKDLAEFTSNKVSYEVLDEKTKKYVTKKYSQMTDAEKATIIERIMSHNSSLAKIYVLTSSGKYKYYASKSEYSELRGLGITKNVFIASGKNEGFK